jgi:glucosyl-3-phosphoglycerate phosphatase
MLSVRHGQSYFNLLFGESRVDPGIEDPELTPLGREQAQALAEQLEGVPLTRIIISPYTRALQTAAPLLEKSSAHVEIMHEVRERSAYTCDIGTAPSALAQRFPRHDFSHLPEQWWPGEVETSEQTVARADAFRTLMAARADSESTLLVSHWAFILALTGKSLTNGELLYYDPHDPIPTDIDWYK